jgi:hypothetical protein
MKKIKLILIIFTLTVICISFVGQKNSESCRIQKSKRLYINSSFDLAEKSFDEAIGVNPR